jgi:hypothetical protein
LLVTSDALECERAMQAQALGRRSSEKRFVLASE